MRSFLIALQFLTRLPVRLTGDPEVLALGRSVLWYPMVGMIIGALLYALDAALPSSVSALLRAGLLLAAWVFLTGALHLDGLADSADAWIGGGGDRERMLQIMKDPHAGAGAVSAIVVASLLKLTALAAVLPDPRLLLLPPSLARAAIPALLACTPYVRPQGIGANLASHLPRRLAVLVVLATLGAALTAYGLAAVAPIVVSLLIFGLLRAWLMTRLGGTTGDTAGALVELIEVGCLVALALSPL